MELYNIGIINRAITDYGENPDPDDPWSRSSTSQENYIEGIALLQGRYGDLYVPFKPVHDQDYYLVSVVYSTGDSFGTDDGQIEFVDLFQTLEKAEALVQLIEQDYKQNPNFEHGKPYETKNRIAYKRDDDTEGFVHTSTWKGYFEHLTDVRVDLVRLK